ncbi:helix-turn-helix domain-containing protein [Bacillus idriensis]|uniref:Helix-turn-helix domain-containing protein n=1 Tax=Metabacillus idriensis TaxID=324768 RepID=A0A6I2M8S2_9BACI|nr:helix-turn-helix transcriptional regulator [Metabacillus idriensis]MRX54715.1 helix-turn-helix domain-containing protein [Metabacillus idriensis]
MGLFDVRKPRSRFGAWLDRKGLTQKEVARKAKISEMSLTRMCSDRDYVPKISTWVKVERALKSMGYSVDRDKFFDA